jgi:hypothetical protein
MLKQNRYILQKMQVREYIVGRLGTAIIIKSYMFVVLQKPVFTCVTKSPLAI